MPKKSREQFPGFAGCVALLRTRKDAEAQEVGYYWLLPQVREFVEPLLAELAAEDGPYMQGWFLELLGDAHDVRAFSAFVQYLFSPDTQVRQWAERGLVQLGETREGRKLLWSIHQQEELLVVPSGCDEHVIREMIARSLQDHRRKS